MTTDYPEGGETFIIAPTPIGGKKSKSLPGFQEAAVADQILSLVSALKAGTPGVSDIKKGAIALAKAGGAKLAKLK